MDKKKMVFSVLLSVLAIAETTAIKKINNPKLSLLHSSKYVTQPHMKFRSKHKTLQFKKRGYNLYPRFTVTETGARISRRSRILKEITDLSLSNDRDVRKQLMEDLINGCYSYDQGLWRYAVSNILIPSLLSLHPNEMKEILDKCRPLSRSTVSRIENNLLLRERKENKCILDKYDSADSINQMSCDDSINQASPISSANQMSCDDSDDWLE
ncbi:MAG: hypothetical protein LBD81_01470 [Holosporaceae bacterium]|jgi:hypothetical protein|nr:hypothetical protein [Holosporaceae bacterium]